MQLSTTTCQYGSPVHWDNHEGSFGILPMDSSDLNGTAFQWEFSTCTTQTLTSGVSTSTITADGMITGFFLLLIFTTLSFGFLLDRVVGVKIRRNLFNTIHKNSRDGKINDDY